MKPFKTAEHISSWAGLFPGNNESAGKRNTCLSAWLGIGKHGCHVEAKYFKKSLNAAVEKAIGNMVR